MQGDAFFTCLASFLLRQTRTDPRKYQGHRPYDLGLVWEKGGRRGVVGWVGVKKRLL